MEINDLKNKILEKLREGKVGRDDVASILQKDSLQAKDAQKTGDKELADLKKSIEEYRAKLDAVEFKNKELKKLYDESIQKYDVMILQFEDKKRALSEVEKKGAIAPEGQKKERTIDTFEILKSRVTTLTKETKDKDIVIGRMEDDLKAKDKKFAENEKIYKNIAAEKNELASALQASEKQKKALNEKLMQMLSGSESKPKAPPVEESKHYAKESELVRNELSLKLQTAEKDNKVLEGKISQLKLEIDAKNKRLDEVEGSYKELDEMVKDSLAKVRRAETEKEELEEKVSQLSLELEAADKKRGDDLALAEEGAEKLKKEIEDIKDVVKEREREEAELNEMVKKALTKARAAETEKEELEEKVLQLNLELEAADKKRGDELALAEEESEKLAREITDIKKVIKEKEAEALELNETILALKSELETRDNKIEADIKYYDKLLKEINKLRQKTQ